MCVRESSETQSVVLSGTLCQVPVYTLESDLGPAEKGISGVGTACAKAQRLKTHSQVEEHMRQRVVAKRLVHGKRPHWSS